MIGTMTRVGRTPVTASRWILAAALAATTVVGPMAAWSRDEDAEFRRAVRPFEEVDPDFWK